MKPSCPFAMTLAAACFLVAAKAVCGEGGVVVPFSGLEWHLPPCARIDGDILTVEVGPETVGETRAWAALDLSNCRDGFVAEIVASGENVSKPSAPWLGFKFMVRYRDPLLAQDSYPGATGATGTFANRLFRIDDTAPGRTRSNARLYLGLEDATGKVSFDLSTLAIAASAPSFRMMNQDWRVSYPERVGRSGARRGFMSPHDPTEKDFSDLREWGATLVRYQMARTTYGWDEERLLDMDAYRAWLDERLDLLDRMLGWAEECGIEIVVDLHHAPGGKDPQRGLRIFYDGRCLAEFVETWRKIATRFKGRRGIYGYDLVNEPTHKSDRLVDYWEVQRMAAEAVREIDPDATIIVESNGMDAPETFAYLSPLAMNNVIYEVHVYVPGAFTHQGVFGGGRGLAPARWPESARGWNRDFIANALRPVREFEARHGAKIYVGEFSAAAWAPGADKYLRDCISLFGEYGWDWTYHAFREASCWDVEMEGSDRASMSPSADNPRKRVLLEGLRGPSGQGAADAASVELLSPVGGRVVALVPDAQKAAMAPESLDGRIAVLRDDGLCREGEVFGPDALWRQSRPLVLEWRATGGTTASWKIEIGKTSDLSSARVWYAGPKDENLVIRPDSQSNGPVKVFSYSVPFANLEIGRTYFWRVTGTFSMVGPSGKGQPVASEAESFCTEDRAPRWIALEGRVGNVRDIGGWRTEDGRRVRQGMAFRGQGLNDNSATGERRGRNRLTVADAEYLVGELGIRTDLDLRRPDETADLAMSPIGPDVKLVLRPSSCYKGIFSKTGKRAMADNIRLFCHEANYPIYFHCIGGADRTGSLAYVLLGVLGVPRHDIETDWESTFYPSVPDMKRAPDFWQRESHFTNGFLKYGEPGDSWRRRIELYLLDCGVLPSEISRLRESLLESGSR